MKSLNDPRVFINKKNKFKESLKKKYNKLLSTIFFIEDPVDDIQSAKKQRKGGKKEGKKEEMKKKKVKTKDIESTKEKDNDRMNDNQNKEDLENGFNELNEENNNSESINIDVNATQTGN